MWKMYHIATVWLSYYRLMSVFTYLLITHVLRERQQLGFVTFNGNLGVNLKPTHPHLLNGKGEFTFPKTKSSHSSGIIVYPPKLEFLRNLQFLVNYELFYSCRNPWQVSYILTSYKDNSYWSEFNWYLWI